MSWCMPYAQPVARDVTLTIRLEAAEREALERAGKAEDRPASYFMRRATRAWLIEGGWLAPEPAVERELRRREEESGDGE